MKQNTVESILGAIVLAVAIMFTVFVAGKTGSSNASGYTVLASFERVDGLLTGNDVRLSGVKVGTVDSISLDPTTFRATVKLALDETLALPTDTMAEVASESLLGGRYVALVPGSDEQTIASGGSITFTQPPVDLVQLLGKFIFSTEASATKTTGN